ncbi:MAG: aldo/keto reductase [Erysipelotrichaceae bacterium]|nr:aldo/keto reductase [Erysipelotrichaceae bacterium]MBR6233400.1 aldo/keto reductase [Erysipelotrichaceae bacterium]
MKFHRDHPEISLAGMGSTQFWNQDSEKTSRCFRMAIEECGITLIDTAELYKGGECEKSVAKALKGIARDSYYLTGKVSPENACAGKMEESLKRSLLHLDTDHFDLYLLHWRENVDLQEFVNEAERFVKQGLIRHWGVSNFDTDDMKDLLSCENGENCFCDQILYNVVTRGPEYDLFPYLKKHGIMAMAYGSTDYRRGGKDLLGNNALIKEICEKTGLSVPSLMLRFVSRNNDIPALFRTSNPVHLKENLKCFDSDVDRYMNLIEKEFPAPDHKVALEKI